MGIGTEQRGDDDVGLRVARTLRTAVGQRSSQATLVGSIAVGTSPETYVVFINSYSPDVILLIDAVDMDAMPGAVAILAAEQLKERPAWNTHRPPLGLFMDYLAQRTGARVLLAGIQAESLDWGTRTSNAARRGANELIRTLRSIFREGDVRL